MKILIFDAGFKAFLFGKIIITSNSYQALGHIRFRLKNSALQEVILGEQSLDSLDDVEGINFANDTLDVIKSQHQKKLKVELRNAKWSISITFEGDKFCYKARLLEESEIEEEKPRTFGELFDQMAK